MGTDHGETKNGKVVIDANWRWTHKTGETTNCYTDNLWDPTLCPDKDTCTQNCVVEGADQEYTDTYGVNSDGSSLTLGFVTEGPYSTNIGSRTFLMADDDAYQLFQLKNKEFTYTVDDSQLDCGLNGALYFVQMDAGAEMGLGYCDAQCPHDLKFINGEANVEGWKPSATDPNAGTGQYGSCCAEMDIWEANSISSAYTAHPCDNDGLWRCENETDCGNTDRYGGVCDQDGCDL